MNPIVDSPVRLEMIQPEHAEPMFNLIDQNREHLRHWLTFPDRTHTVDDVMEYIHEVQQRHREGKELAFAIFVENDMVGRIALHKIDHCRGVAEMATWITAGAQGRGIAHAARRALLQFGFAELNLKRIESRTAVDNQRNHAALQRLNFKFEKILPQAKNIGNKHIDLALYYLDAPDSASPEPQQIF